MTEKTNPIRAAALRLAEAGWALLPLRPKSKEPANEHGCVGATRDPNIIATWWDRWPQANLGVATGQVSGLVVVDIDGPDGRASWGKLEAEHGFVETLAQQTGRPDGGRQLFFSHPGNMKVPCRTKFLPGLDCRGDGGYVVVPPSIHPSGARYKWLSKGKPAPLPDWLLELIANKEPRAAPKNGAPVQITRTASPGPGWSRRARAALEGECENVARAPEGTWNDALNAAAYSLGQLVACGEAVESEVEQALIDASSSGPWGASIDSWIDRARKTIASGLRSGEASPRQDAPRVVDGPPQAAQRHATPQTPQPHTEEEPPPIDDEHLVEAAAEPPRARAEDDHSEWRSELLMGGKAQNVIRSVLSNAVVLIRHHPGWRGALAWDARCLRAEWVQGPPWAIGSGPRPVVENDAVEASRWFAAEEGVAFGADALWQAMIAEAGRAKIDRVRAYLDGLVWDEQPRIDTWLVDLIGADPGGGQGDSWPEYAKAVGSSWLVSAIARAMVPGCQADHMIVLEGPQGTLKSSSLAALGGPFYAELALDVESRDSQMAAYGPWIIEWSELAGLSRRESEAVKSFISRRTDRFRPPYGRHVEDHARSCVFAGTTNESISLTDATGNRRYWPVRIGRAQPEAIAGARDQLWAEALFRYNCGEHWWLSPELEATARSEQEARLESDAWEEAIEHALDHGTLQSRDFVTTGDLYGALQLGAAQQTSGAGRRLARLMDRLGWRADRGYTTEGRRRGYHRPGRLIGMTGTEGAR